MDAFECDRTTMAMVAAALADDSDGAVTLLSQLGSRDVARIAIRLAAMTADALVAVAEETGGGREEALAQWQACIIAHEARRDG